jgi:cytoskeletal protein CcmA (bactofilin family)
MVSKASSETTLSEGTKLRGRISGEGNLHILGTVEGNVAMQGSVIIGAAGSMNGESLEAREVVIDGQVASDVDASQVIRIGASASVRGRLRGASFVIHPGASVAAELDSDFELPAELHELTTENAFSVRSHPQPSL